MATPYFVELQRTLQSSVELQDILSFSKFYSPISIFNSELKLHCQSPSYTVIFSTSLRANCSSYASGSFYPFPQKIPHFFNSLLFAISFSALSENILPLLPQFMTLIRSIPIILFAICQLQKFLLHFFQSTDNLLHLLPAFILQHLSNIFFQNR